MNAEEPDWDGADIYEQPIAIPGLPAISDPLKPVPASRHPFQFWVLVAFWFFGWVTIIIIPDTAFSQSISKLVDFIYGALLVVSCTTALVSAWWKDRITGLLLEKNGLGGLSMAATIYGGFLVISYGWTGVPNGVVNIGVAIASIWRIRHVNRELLATIRLINSRPDDARSNGSE